MSERTQPTLSRRDLLRGAAALVVAAGVPALLSERAGAAEASVLGLEYTTSYPAGTIDIAGCPTLQYGQGEAMSTIAVIKAQKMLNDTLPAGQRIAVDGDYGPATARAVWNFQASRGIPTTANVGNLTWTELVRAPVDPTWGRGVYVDQSRKRITVMDQGGIYAQGAMIDNPAELPQGEFNVQGWVGEGSWGYDYSEQWLLPNFVWFHGSAGFHAIPLAHDTMAPMHGPEYLGSGATESHGCIRLSPQMSATVWEHTMAGTRVAVF